MNGGAIDADKDAIGDTWPGRIFGTTIKAGLEWKNKAKWRTDDYLRDN